MDRIIVCMKYPCIVPPLQEGLEDTKAVIKIHKSKKYRQRNDHKKKKKKTNNDLQSTTEETDTQYTQYTQYTQFLAKLLYSTCCNHLRQF